MFSFFRKQKQLTRQESSADASFANDEPEIRTVSTAVAPAPTRKTQEDYELERLAQLRLALKDEFVSVEKLPELFSCRLIPRSLAQIKEEITATADSLQQINQRYDVSVAELLPVESELREKLNTKRNRLVAELQMRLSQLQLEETAYLLDQEFNRIDMSFLHKARFSEEHKCGVPLFAVFSIGDPFCSFMHKMVWTRVPESMTGRGWHHTLESNVPPELLSFFNLKGLYESSSQALPANRRITGIESKMQARFTGVIPQAVRELIRLSAPKFDRILLVTEAPKWHISQRLLPEPTPTGDPLVIGQKSGLFWLLAAFDTTPSEEYVKREFTFGQL